MKASIAELKVLAASAAARMSARLPRPLPAPSEATVRSVVAWEIARRSPVGTAAEHLTPEHRLMRDLELDSLDRVSLALAVEEGLDLAGTLDSTRWETVGDVVRAASALVAELPG